MTIAEINRPLTGITKGSTTIEKGKFLTVTEVIDGSVDAPELIITGSWTNNGITTTKEVKNSYPWPNPFNQ
jgi:hypothetical protein